MGDWSMRGYLAAAVLAGGTALAIGVGISRRRARAPSSLSHLRVGRIWEYDVIPGQEVERTSVLESMSLPDGRTAFRLEFRRGDVALDAVFSNDSHGRLIQLSQSHGAATFDPPLVGLGELRVGAYWSTRSDMVSPSMMRASTATEVSGRVVALETVTVPAGTFQAYRIEQVTNGRACTAWHVPGLGMVREVAFNERLALRRVIDTE